MGFSTIEGDMGEMPKPPRATGERWAACPVFNLPHRTFVLV